MTISREEVVHVATLARLGLSESEIELFREQLGTVLRHMETLAELDLSDVPPSSLVVPLQDVERPDEPRPSLPLDSVLANAPREEDGYFRVAPVFEGD